MNLQQLGDEELLDEHREACWQDSSYDMRTAGSTSDYHAEILRRFALAKVYKEALQMCRDVIWASFQPHFSIQIGEVKSILKQMDEALGLLPTAPTTTQTTDTKGD